MYKIIIAASLALGLAACTPTATSPEPNSTPSVAASDCGIATGITADEKGLIAVETAYNVAAHAYVTLDGAGKLSPTLKANTRPVLIQAYDNLKLARTAYSAGNDCDFIKYADAANSFANYAKTLLN